MRGSLKCFLNSLVELRRRLRQRCGREGWHRDLTDVNSPHLTADFGARPQFYPDRAAVSLAARARAVEHVPYRATARLNVFQHADNRYAVFERESEAIPVRNPGFASSPNWRLGDAIPICPVADVLGDGALCRYAMTLLIKRAVKVPDRRDEDRCLALPSIFAWHIERRPLLPRLKRSESAKGFVVRCVEGGLEVGHRVTSVLWASRALLRSDDAILWPRGQGQLGV